MKTIKHPEVLTFEEKIELLKSGNFNIYQKTTQTDKYEKLLKDYISNGDIVQEKVRSGKAKSVYYYSSNTVLKDTIEIGTITHKALKVILAYHNLPETFDFKNSKFGDFEIDFDKSLRDNPIEEYSGFKKAKLAKILMSDDPDMSFLDAWKYSYKGDNKTEYEQSPSWTSDIKAIKNKHRVSADGLGYVIHDIWKCMDYHNLLTDYPNPCLFDGWVE